MNVGDTLTLRGQHYVVVDASDKDVNVYFEDLIEEHHYFRHRLYRRSDGTMWTWDQNRRHPQPLTDPAQLQPVDDWHRQQCSYLDDVVNVIDPLAAMKAVTRLAAYLGAVEQWNGGDFCEIAANELGPIMQAARLPSINNSDPAATRFWQRVNQD